MESRKEKLTKKKKTHKFIQIDISSMKKRPRRRSPRAEKKFYVHFLWRRKFRVLHPSRYRGAVNTRELSNPGIILNKRLVFEENLSRISHTKSNTMFRVRKCKPFRVWAWLFCMSLLDASGSYKKFFSVECVGLFWIG